MYKNLSDCLAELEIADEKMQEIIDAIPGGIVIYEIIDDNIDLKYFSDGAAAICGYDRNEYEEIVHNQLDSLVHDCDRERVAVAIKKSAQTKEDLKLSYRICHKNGDTIWIHMHSRYMNPKNKRVIFYSIFSGISKEERIFESIVNETADGIYVIDKKNYDLFYANESIPLFIKQGENAVGQKCYAALHGKTEPCEFCTLKTHNSHGDYHDMMIDDSDRFYATKFREFDWNGISVYIKYVSDITDEVHVRKEKERLEMYFKTIVEKLPGGVSVVKYFNEETITTEFLSEGFASLVGMRLDEARNLYSSNAMHGIHDDDKKAIIEKLDECIKNKENHLDVIYRMKKGSEYIWVKSNLSIINEQDDYARMYLMHSDMTQEYAAQEKIHRQYTNVLLNHYHTSDPNAILVGHCDVTKNKILELKNTIGYDLLKFHGCNREEFFTLMSTFIVDAEERQNFLDNMLREPVLQAFNDDRKNLSVKCYIELPDEAVGRYIRADVLLVTMPDSGNVMGVLTVTDITEQTMIDNIFNRISRTSYDFVADVDIFNDTYRIISADKRANTNPSDNGIYSNQVETFLNRLVVPRDKKHCEEMLNVEYMVERLKKEQSYSFSYSIVDHKGNIETKNMTISEVDMRFGRVCIARTDITKSVREQQSLLNVISYIFEMTGIVDVDTKDFTIYTRKIMVNNLPPYFGKDFDSFINDCVENHGAEDEKERFVNLLKVEDMCKLLVQKPDGYDFTFPYQCDNKLYYKQMYVMWGDENHKTICVVRADVTDTIMAERKSRKQLEDALELAKETNRFKSDFLSSMSHDIRTPMNAIIGMTDIALSDPDDKEQVMESLSVIKNSSNHLLHLINDILDMSRIESGKMSLVTEKFSHKQETENLVSRIRALADIHGVEFEYSLDIKHDICIGDTVRINQVLDNLIGNSIKFTPKGGKIYYTVNELPSKNRQTAKYIFRVEDTGIGIDEDSIKHIFEPFYRAENAKTAQIEGTGLGLSIVKNIVEYMGGVIDVSSEEGNGTVFKLELPMRIETSAETVQDDVTDDVTQEMDIKGMKILLVEDHPINRLVAKRILENMNARVVIAKDGLEGVERFCKSNHSDFDVICMDIQMPVMDGYEATHKIRTSHHPDAKSIPIIAMTANTFSNDIHRCMEIGMNAHIAKPIDAGKLYAVLNSFHSERID